LLEHTYNISKDSGGKVVRDKDSHSNSGLLTKEQVEKAMKDLFENLDLQTSLLMTNKENIKS
jgi:hypothetical protein